MGNIIKQLFHLCGFTVMTNSNAEYLEWSRKHWKDAYDENVKSYNEYKEFVNTDIIGGWDKTVKHNTELIELSNDLLICAKCYRHQLTDMGVAVDRLMGELVSAHGYTEQDIAECLGMDDKSYEPDTPLYNQVQKHLLQHE